MNTELKTILKGYLECLSWVNEDKELSLSDIKGAIITCNEFFRQITYSQLYEWNSEYSLEHMGHDLMLTKSGHGTGFWDKDDIGKLADDLTYIAENIKENRYEY